MTRDRVQILVAALAAFWVLVATCTSAPASTVDRCRPSGSHTLLSTHTLRVYRTRKTGHGEAASDLIVACWLASARNTVLVTESPRDESNDVKLTTVEAAPGSTSVIGVSSSTTGVGLVETDFLQAINVHSGHTLNSNEAELLSCEEGCDVRIFSFVVAPSGTLAFVGGVSGASPNRPPGLYAIPVGHSPHLLEHGVPPQQPEPGVPTITNLAYAKETLSWNSNGSPMSAPLS